MKPEDARLLKAGDIVYRASFFAPKNEPPVARVETRVVSHIEEDRRGRTRVYSTRDDRPEILTYHDSEGVHATRGEATLDLVQRMDRWIEKRMAEVRPIQELRGRVASSSDGI